jgi:hypothetical protein
MQTVHSEDLPKSLGESRSYPAVLPVSPKQLKAGVKVMVVGFWVERGCDCQNLIANRKALISHDLID